MPDERSCVFHRARRAVQLVCLAAFAVMTACGDHDDAAHTSTTSTAAYPRDTTLRLNHIQALGTHNSYHIQPRPEIFDLIQRRLPAVADMFKGLEYTHLPLDQQFTTHGIRQIELDVFADPNGGLFSNRVAQRLLGENPASGIPELDQPGFKVLHIQDLDFHSTCWTFVECLTTVKAWSDAHAGHMPIMVLVEAKDEIIPVTGSAIPIPIRGPQLDALDAEIRSVLPASKIITPDDVRGSRATLEEAIRSDGWPTLATARGRILFTLDNEDVIKDSYLEGHPSLRGRILFTSSAPGAPEAAFVKLNDPIADNDTIRRVVADGFIVRTRSDADTVEARSGDTRMRDAAIASGAQWVSTDYPVPNPAFGTGYQVMIPGGMPARCNPISAPPGCTALDIESPQHLTSR